MILPPTGIAKNVAVGFIVAFSVVISAVFVDVVAFADVDSVLAATLVCCAPACLICAADVCVIPTLFADSRDVRLIADQNPIISAAMHISSETYIPVFLAILSLLLLSIGLLSILCVSFRV